MKLIKDISLKLICLIAVALFGVAAMNAQTPQPKPTPTTCNGYNTPYTNSKGWEQGKTVEYYIDPSISGTDAVNAINDAFDNWTLSKNENGSGVSYQRVMSPPPAGTGITIKSVPDIVNVDQNGVERRARADAQVTDRDSSNYALAAEIRIDNVMTGYDAVLEAVSHEIGHPAGFADCIYADGGCTEGDSIMAGVEYDGNDKSTYNQSYGRYTAPTKCDNQALKDSNYVPNPIGGGGGGGDPGTGGGGPGYPCTPYYWVYYESWDGGRTWEMVDVSYAGCW